MTKPPEDIAADKAEWIELIVDQKKKFKPVMVHNKSHNSAIANFSMDIMKILVAQSNPDGETSSGHPKAKRLLPEEVVHEAIALAEIAFDLLEKKGWIVKVPSISDLEYDDKTGF